MLNRDSNKVLESVNTRTRTSSAVASAINYHSRYSYSDRLYIEQLLSAAGFYPGNVDGTFTESTINAIKALQRYIGVTADGKFGPATIRRIEELLD